MRKLTFILLPLICLILSCNSDQPVESEKAPVTEAPTAAKSEAKPKEALPANNSEVTELSKTFPKIYLDAGLPSWKKATIDRVNQLQSGGSTKYQIVLSSPEDIHTIVKYYDGAMKKGGWTPTNMSKSAEKKDRRMMVFRKDGIRFIMNVLHVPEQENRIITMMFGEDLK